LATTHEVIQFERAKLWNAVRDRAAISAKGSQRPSTVLALVVVDTPGSARAFLANAVCSDATTIAAKALALRTGKRCAAMFASSVTNFCGWA
jgi:hypothetical protein